MPVYIINPSETPTKAIEKRIWAALRTWPNQIAGRPNAGNLALPMIQQYAQLPPSVLLGYTERTLRAFLPTLVFRVRIRDAPPFLTNWQGVEVEYALEESDT